jgi:hypothetical protein
MSGEIITAWVSKYALTEGVRAHRVKTCGSDMVNLLKPDGSSGWGYLHKGDWHLTKDAADQKAEQMRLRKIASVKKQLARLEALSFTSGVRDRG